MWALGVVVYVLLCGKLPFHGNDDDAIGEAILYAPLQFKPGATSEQAQSFVSGLLQRNPEKRLTAIEALGHDWLHTQPSNASAEASLPPPLTDALPQVVSSMVDFSHAAPIKRYAYHALAFALPSAMDEVRKLRHAFVEMDRNDSGGLSREEFRSALEMAGLVTPSSDPELEGRLEAAFRAMDPNNTGEIEWRWFLAATLRTANLPRATLHGPPIYQAFMLLDRDCDGRITVDDLLVLFKEHGSEEEVREMLRGAIGTKSLNLEDFKLMMYKPNDELPKKVDAAVRLAYSEREQSVRDSQSARREACNSSGDQLAEPSLVRSASVA